MGNPNYNKSKSSNPKANSYRGKKRPNKNQRSDKWDRDTTKRDAIKDAINDISWYAHNPQMLKDSASIAFNQMLGLDMDFGNFVGPEHTWTRMPGLVTLPVCPAFGSWASGPSNRKPNNALNVAAQNLYSYVRHANSGHSNYDAPDLMIYILAMDQVYSYHAELVRIYGLMRFYSGYNRYLGKYLVQALGYNYDDLITKLPALRYLINTFAARISTFAVPSIFPMFERHRWIYSNVYMDRPSTRAQCYAFVPYTRGIYNEPTTVGETAYLAGIKATTPAFARYDGLTEIQTTMDNMLTPLLHSEDIGIMSGDILKAYGADKCYQANALPEDYTVGPVYIPEVLRQIHNLVTVGAPIMEVQNGEDMLVYQDGTTPYIYSWSQTRNMVPAFGSDDPGPAILGCKCLEQSVLLDTDVDSPTPEDVMIMSRLTNMPKYAADGVIRNVPQWGALPQKVVSYECSYEGFGADAVVAICVHGGKLFDSGSEAGRPEYTVVYTHALQKVGDEGGALGLSYGIWSRAIAQLMTFAWHPTIYVHAISQSSWTTESMNHNIEDLAIMGDLDNCVPVQEPVISRIHEVALLSLLNVPSAVLTKGI